MVFWEESDENILDLRIRKPEEDGENYVMGILVICTCHLILLG
jgi:hypothetical protein